MKLKEGSDGGWTGQNVLASRLPELDLQGYRLPKVELNVRMRVYASASPFRSSNELSVQCISTECLWRLRLVLHGMESREWESPLSAFLCWI